MFNLNQIVTRGVYLEGWEAMGAQLSDAIQFISSVVFSVCSAPGQAGQQNSTCKPKCATFYSSNPEC